MNFVIDLVIVVIGAILAGVVYVAQRHKETPVTTTISALSWGILLIWVLRTILYWYVDIRTEQIWFGSVGYETVYNVQIQTRVFFYVVAFLVSLPILWAVGSAVQQIGPEKARTYTVWVKRWLVFLSALVLAHLAMNQWWNWLMFSNSIPFGQTDPVYNQDLSVYMFQYPWYRAVQWWFMMLVVMAVIVAGCLAVVNILLTEKPVSRYETIVVNWGGYFTITAILIGLYCLMLAWQNNLDQYSLVIDGTSPTVSGAGWLDVNTRIPTAKAATFVFAIFGMLWICVPIFWDNRLPGMRDEDNLFKRVRKFGGSLLGALLIYTFVAFMLIPHVKWSIQLNPNQTELEGPYIDYQIHDTLFGYDLNDYQTVEIPFQESLTPEEYRQNDATLSNTRIQDWQILLQYLQQLQTARPYYQFSDVDFIHDPEFGMLMGSIREMNVNLLSNYTWINGHLSFNHGYGYVMTRTNEFTENGDPVFVASGFPTTGIYASSHPTANERIYYGEILDWTIVGTTEQEVDRPLEEGVAYHHYQGGGGIPMDSWTRLLFAIRFNDPQIIFSNLLTDESHLLWRRNISDIVSQIAPFLSWDNDPYFVVAPDQITWMLNGFSLSNNLPYSEGGTYIRHNVIASIGAYDGAVHFYQMGDDPILQLWMNTFNIAMEPSEDMPTYLTEQIRYPEDLFVSQSDILTRYHLQTRETWYNADGVWHIPDEEYRVGAEQVMDARFIWARLPAETQNEMLLVRPYVPRERTTMAAWLVARMDGTIQLWKFPGDDIIEGPENMQSTISNDEVLRQTITMSNQQGSEILWGNTIVLPVLGNDGRATVVMSESMFTQSLNHNTLPELQRVIFYVDDELYIGESLADVLDQLYTGRHTTVLESLTTGEGAITLTNEAAQQLIQAVEAGNVCLSQSDITCFGQQWEVIRQVIADARPE